jgi:hypothetical protein
MAQSYSLLYSVRELAAMKPDVIELRQGPALLSSRTPDAGDPDYYVQFRAARR